jgi:hypothetical protein
VLRFCVYLRRNVTESILVVVDRVVSPTPTRSGDVSSAIRRVDRADTAPIARALLIEHLFAFIFNELD